jgi:hypothetical protein
MERTDRPKRSRLARAAVTGVCVAGMAAAVPRAVVGRDADRFYDGDRATHEALARAVAEYVAKDTGPGAFHTGDARFDGEWTVATHQMAALGLGQVIRAHPELRGRYAPVVRRAVENLLRERAWRFGASAWGRGPFESLDTDEGHAYLGYIALGMGALREVDPASPHHELHDRVIAALARRLERSPHGAIETYPGEAYPCDIASVVGAIGQHARLTGTDRRVLIARMADLYRRRWRDPRSGYLVQSVSPRTADPTAPPRASGTALAAYFLSFADRALAGELGLSLARTGHVERVGFGAVREYAPGHEGRGDIDSGPVVLGVSVSATGFALATARQLGDRTRYRELYRTAALFGVPVARGERRRFLAGGPIGNAILLAMLTAEAR